MEAVDIKESAPQRAIRVGVISAVTVATIDTWVDLRFFGLEGFSSPLFSDDQYGNPNISLWGAFLDAGVYFGLAFGLYRRNRAAAVGLVVWQLIVMAYAWPWYFPEGERFHWVRLWVALSFLALFARAARATFVIKKQKDRLLGYRV